jgi:ribonuclease HI
MTVSSNHSNYSNVLVPAIATMHFDGGSRGNPGLSAGAATIEFNGRIFECSKLLSYATNNEAEYTGLIVGLEKAIGLGVKRIHCLGDSQLVVNQIDGTWGCNKQHLQPLIDKTRALLRSFDYWDIGWIPRANNSAPDAICNRVMDEASGVSLSVKGNREVTPSGNPQIDQLNKLAGKASFKDVASLKVPGSSDKFTKLRLSALSDLAGLDTIAEVKQIWEVRNKVDRTSNKPGFDLSDRDLASVLRWILRGLTIDLAVKKVRVGLEIAANCH